MFEYRFIISTNRGNENKLDSQHVLVFDEVAQKDTV